jgi:hypothetical protein
LLWCDPAKERDLIEFVLFSFRRECEAQFNVFEVLRVGLYVDWRNWFLRKEALVEVEGGCDVEVSEREVVDEAFLKFVLLGLECVHLEGDKLGGAGQHQVHCGFL